MSDDRLFGNGSMPILEFIETMGIADLDKRMSRLAGGALSILISEGFNATLGGVIPEPGTAPYSERNFALLAEGAQQFIKIKDEEAEQFWKTNPGSETGPSCSSDKAECAADVLSTIASLYLVTGHSFRQSQMLSPDQVARIAWAAVMLGNCESRLLHASAGKYVGEARRQEEKRRRSESARDARALVDPDRKDRKDAARAACSKAIRGGETYRDWVLRYAAATTTPEKTLYRWTGDLNPNKRR